MRNNSQVQKHVLDKKLAISIVNVGIVDNSGKAGSKG